MNDIQKAREVLGKYRAKATQGSWEARVPERPYLEYADIYSGDAEVAWNADCDGALRRVDADLIVLTAGNPELLDAIDICLHLAEQSVKRNVGSSGGVITVAVRIAAAIIAADERMRS